MTARQVAARLGVSTALVYKLCERNELGSLRIGGALRFRLAATGRATSRHDAIRAASGAVSRDDAEADVDDLRSRAALQPALVEALQKHARCLLADALPVDGHSRQRRLSVRGRRQIAEAHHGDLTGDLYPARARLVEHAHRELIRGAEYGVEGVVGQQIPERLPAHSQRRGRAQDHLGDQRSASLLQSSDESLAANLRTLIVGDDQREPLPPALDEVVGRATPDVLVRKAHQHIDGRRREVPGLHYRDLRAEKPPPALGRVHYAREDDRGRTAPDDGGDELVLVGCIVFRKAQEELVPGTTELDAECLDEIGEDRVERARDYRDDHPARL